MFIEHCTLEKSYRRNWKWEKCCFLLNIFSTTAYEGSLDFYDDAIIYRWIRYKACDMHFYCMKTYIAYRSYFGTFALKPLHEFMTTANICQCIISAEYMLHSKFWQCINFELQRSWRQQPLFTFDWLNSGYQTQLGNVIYA